MPSVSSSPAPFTVRVEPSGRQFEVAVGETILAAGIRQGVNLPYGCQDGACGSCKCLRLSGAVQMGPHQSQALSDSDRARELILTCCTQVHSDVVLQTRQVTAAGAWPVRKIPVRVATLERLAPDVIRLQLQLPASEHFQYFAGQYVEFLLKDGARRSYSMANAPHLSAQGLELHIRHMPGGLFTDQLFGSMKERDILRIEGPFGSFRLREDRTAPIILLASGTGFAPVKAMLEHMLHTRNQRPVTLYWGVRRPHDLYLDAWVQDALTRLPGLRYLPVVSDAWTEDEWTGRSGWVHQAVLQDHPDLSGFEVYASGAPVMVEAAQRDFAQAGLPDDAFFADAFLSLADRAPAPQPA